MTASTELKEENKKNKVIKKKGPIRTEALISIFIIIALMGLYTKIFFDSHIRKGMEWTATYIHGAEVNIDAVCSSFFGARFEIKGLEITDKKKPENNIVKIGEIKLSLLWDALLKAKFVIEEAAVLNIEVNSPRENIGELVSPEDYKVQSESLSKLEGSVMAQGKEELDGSALGDVAKVLGGADPKNQVKEIEGELKSEKKIRELEAGLSTKEVEWKSKINNINHKEKFDRITNKAKAVKFDKSKPWESIKQYKTVLTETKLVFSDYQKVSTELKNDVSNYAGGLGDIDKLIKEDMNDIQKRFNIPNLNFKDFSKALFGRIFKEKVKNIYKYMEIAKEYMPPSKAEGDTPDASLIPHQRGKGRNYKFTTKDGYPLFWLKKGLISSKASSSEYSGDINGEITDLTSDPQFLGRAAVINILGDFPKQEISGLDISIILDHTKLVPKQTLRAKVSSYPIRERSLSESDQLKFSIKKANGQIDLQATVEGNEVNVLLVNWFNSVVYSVDSDKPVVKKMMQNIVAGIPHFQVQADAKGSWEKLDWNISSTLGKRLASGIKGQVGAKVNEAKKKARKMIDDKIGPKKAVLTQKYEQLKSKLSSMLSSKDKEVSSAKDQAVASSTKKKASPAKKGKSFLKNLGKRFKF